MASTLPGNPMCVDSRTKKADMNKAVGLYPCHGQGGNQVELESLDCNPHCDSSRGCPPGRIVEARSSRASTASM